MPDTCLLAGRRIARVWTVNKMSRVYRALEKAEKERQEKLKTESPSRVVEEVPSLKKEEPLAVPPVERPKEIDLRTEEEAPILVAPPGSFAAEQFRKLKTQIFHWSPKPPQVILVTSTTPHEGKTIVAFNLAAGISQEIQKKAILVDADLRRPSIHLKQQRHEKGLSSYLRNQATLSEILIHLDEHLWVIPAGPASEKSSELIGTKGMGEFIGLLRGLGEDTYIILDSPPVFSTSDPVLLSKMVDGVIWVVMADQTPRESVRRAMRSVDREKIIGVVLNQVDTKPSRYYSKYYYTHYKK